MYLTKILLLLSLFSHFSYGCATCSIMVPTVEVNAQLQIKEKILHQIDFRWYFSEVFTKQLIKQYDKNRNKVLDTNELNQILEAKRDYLEPRNTLTTIQYADENASEGSTLEASFEDYKIEVMKIHSSSPIQPHSKKR